MQAVIPLVAVLTIIGNQLVIAEIFFVLIQLVCLVTDFLTFRAPLALSVETANAFMVLVDDAAFLRTVQVLCIFLLRVLRRTEMNEWECDTCLQKSVLVLRHQVILNLNTCWHTPTIAFYQSEHIPKAVKHQDFILFPCVRCANHTLADHIISIVSVNPLLGVFQLSCQVHVIHCDLAQRELTCMAVHVRHLFVHEGGVTHKLMFN